MSAGDCLLLGTFRKYAVKLTMSAPRDKAEIALARNQVRKCEGFRMPAHDDGATHAGAGVRKPPMEETAGRDTSGGAA
jgi:hypothetical protein